ncbi:MAG: lysylphosphatidylglycerol synthase transmembrane domain-containing protein [archaeon]
MNKKFLISVSILAGIAALWMIFKFISIDEIFNAFGSASIKNIISFLVVSIALICTLSWRWKVILKSQNIEVPFYNVIAYRLIGYGISYLTPAAKLGGEPVRAALLTRHGVKFPKALSSIIIDKTIDFSTAALFFFMGILTILFSLTIPEGTGILLLVFATVFLATMIFIYQRLSSGKGIIKKIVHGLRLHKIKKLKLTERKIESFEKLIIKFFREDKTDFLLTIGISLLAWVLMFLEYKFAGLIIGQDLSFLAIFLIVSFVGVAFLIPIPMAMGSLEASQLAVFSMLAIKNASGVALAFVIRARDLMWSLAGMILLSYYGIKISSTLKKGYDIKDKTK